MLLLFEGEQGARQTQHFTEEMLSVGHLSWDLHSGDMQWSRGLYNLLGAELSSVRPCVSEFDRFIHPDDRHLLASAEQMLRQSVAIEREFRVVSLSGRLRWIALKAEPIAGNERDLARVIGICSDVTRRQEDVLLLQQNQRRLQAIARLSGVLCWVSKPDGSFEDTRIFSGHYSLIPTQGAFWPVDSIVADVKGATSQNFTVVPYLEITNLTHQQEADSLVMTFQLQAPRTSGLPQIIDATEFVNNTSFVGSGAFIQNFYTQPSATVTINSTWNPTIAATTYRTVVHNLQPGWTYYARIGVRVNDSYKKYDLSDIVEIALPTK